MFLFDRTKSAYEFISFVMVLVYASLPLFAIFGPEKYGTIFKMFSCIEIFTLLICIVAYVTISLIGIFVYSYKLVADRLIINIKNYFSDQPYAIVFLIALMLTVVSVIMAPDKTRAIYGTEFRPDGLLMYGCFASLFIFSSSLKNIKFKKMIFGVYVLSFVVVSLIMLQQYYGIIGSAKVAEPPSWTGALEDCYTALGVKTGHFYKGMTGTFYNSNHMGYYIAVCSAICSGFFISSKKIITSVAFAIICAYSYWILIINDTLGAFIALFGVLILTALYLSLKKKIGFIKAFAPVLIFVIVCTCFSVVQLKTEKTTIGTNMTQVYNDVKNIVKAEDKSEVNGGSGRWKLWVGAAKMISAKPVLGYGPDNLKVPSKMYKMSMDRAHSEFLEISAASGIPCAIFYCVGVLSALFISTKRKNFMKKELTCLMATMAVGAYFISSLVGVFLFYTGCHLFIMLGLVRE